MLPSNGGVGSTPVENVSMTRYRRTEGWKAEEHENLPVRLGLVLCTLCMGPPARLWRGCGGLHGRRWHDRLLIVDDRRRRQGQWTRRLGSLDRLRRGLRAAIVLALRRRRLASGGEGPLLHGKKAGGAGRLDDDGGRGVPAMRVLGRGEGEGGGLGDEDGGHGGEGEEEGAECWAGRD